MFKIFLFPREEYLTEYDLGIRQHEISFIDSKIETLCKKFRESSWREKEKYRDKHDAQVNNLREQKQTLLKEQQSKIGLVNSRRRAEIAIRHFIAFCDKYQRCEFEIVKAKK